MSEISKALSCIGQFISALVSGGGYFAAVCIFALALLVTSDVLLRYAFNAPLAYGTEISAYLLVAAAFLGAAYTLREERHINVDILVKRLPQGGQSYLGLATSMATLMFTCLLTWATYDFVREAYTRGYKTGGGLPAYVPEIVLPVGVGLLTLQLFATIIKNVRSMMTKDGHWRLW